jgi:hypothetical protein
MQKQLLQLIFSLTCAGLLYAFNCQGQEPVYYKSPLKQQFVLSAGAGYGFSNNLCNTCESNEWIGGMTFMVNMGYRLNEKITIEAGPTFWFEGDDLVNKNVADDQRPNNKRTFIMLNATYQHSVKFPLSFRLGAGAGSICFTPDKETVRSGEQSYENTEIFKGYSIAGGLMYEVTLCRQLKMNPSLNFYYIGFESGNAAYNSKINYERASITMDILLRLNLKF